MTKDRYNRIHRTRGGAGRARLAGIFPIRHAERLAERIEVCFRAQMLDEVIDPLTHFVEARAAPSQHAIVQLAKRKRHKELLERYTSSWHG